LRIGRRDIVKRGEFGKRLHDLEGARQAESRRLIGFHPGDVLAIERYNPRACRCHAADSVDQRGLAGAVRPNQA
jgi:hypothetical protein